MVQGKFCPRTDMSESMQARCRRSFDMLLAVTVAGDFTACERIRRNLSGGSPSAVRLGRNEPALIHFHQTLHHRLG